MAKGSREAEIREIASRVAAGAGVELYDLELGRKGPRWVLTVYIDRSGGPVTLADCQAVSEQLGAELEAADPIPRAYTLEVSSPGLDRVLRTREHWERSLGERVRLSLRETREGRRRFRGRLVSATEGHLVVEAEEVGRLAFDLDEVHSARLEPEF
jgi:ribosome maturation factor RimP